MRLVYLLGVSLVFPLPAVVRAQFASSQSPQVVSQFNQMSPGRVTTAQHQSRNTITASVLPVAGQAPMPMTPSVGNPPMVPTPPVNMAPQPQSGMQPLPNVGNPTSGGTDTYVDPRYAGTPVATPNMQSWTAVSDGPITYELYFRAGVNLPWGNDFLNETLNEGWVASFGGRTLFFDSDGTSAFAVDIHGMYTYNNSGSPLVTTFRGSTFNVRSLMRTGVGIGLGEDIFTAGSGIVGTNYGLNMRYGYDAGVRFGTSHVDLNPTTIIGGYSRHHDVYWEPFAGIHATSEIPMGSSTFLIGGRVEGYWTSTDVLPGGGDLSGVNVLLSLGWRF
ncbi:MAG: hypothetical protein R3B84_16315 [Zavarzinella sp.]